MTVPAANQHRDALLFGVAVDQVFAAVFHLEHRFFHRHGFAALVMIHPENTGRRVAVYRRRSLLGWPGFGGGPRLGPASLFAPHGAMLHGLRLQLFERL